MEGLRVLVPVGGDGWMDGGVIGLSLHEKKVHPTAERPSKKRRERTTRHIANQPSKQGDTQANTSVDQEMLKKRESTSEKQKIALTTVGFEPTLFRTSNLMHQVNLKLAP